MEWLLDNIPRIVGAILFFGVLYMILEEMISKS